MCLVFPTGKFTGNLGIILILDLFPPPIVYNDLITIKPSSLHVNTYIFIQNMSLEF